MNNLDKLQCADALVKRAGLEELLIKLGLKDAPDPVQMNRGVAAGLGLTPFGIGNTIYAANKADDLGVGMQHGLGVTAGQGSGGIAGLILGMNAKSRPKLKGALGALLGAPIGGMGWGAGMASGFNDIQRRKAGLGEKSAFWRREPKKEPFNMAHMALAGGIAPGLGTGLYAGIKDDSVGQGLKYGLPALLMGILGAKGGAALSGRKSVKALLEQIDDVASGKEVSSKELFYNALNGTTAKVLGSFAGGHAAGAATGAAMSHHRNQNV